MEKFVRLQCPPAIAQPCWENNAADFCNNQVLGSSAPTGRAERCHHWNALTVGTEQCCSWTPLARSRARTANCFENWRHCTPWQGCGSSAQTCIASAAHSTWLLRRSLHHSKCVSETELTGILWNATSACAALVLRNNYMFPVPSSVTLDLRACVSEITTCCYMKFVVTCW